MFLYEPKIDTSGRVCDPRNAWESFTADFGSSFSDLATSSLGVLLLLLFLGLIALRIASLPIIKDRVKSIAAVSVLAGMSAGMSYSVIGAYRPDIAKILTIGIAAALAVSAALVSVRILQGPRST